MKEKKHRVEDALQATRAALEEGIVPGGGIALLHAQKAIQLDRFEDEDEKTGAKIVLRALEEPLRQIAHNGGLEGSVVVSDVRKREEGPGPECSHWRDRRPGQGGHHRPGDGHALGAPERGVDRQEHPHHRGDRRRDRGHERRWRRNARHERDDVARAPRLPTTVPFDLAGAPDAQVGKGRSSGASLPNASVRRQPQRNESCKRAAVTPPALISNWRCADPGTLTRGSGRLCHGRWL